MNVVYLSLRMYYNFFVEAVHRFYESRRRIFNDGKPERKESAEKSKRSSKKRERRKRVCIYVVVVAGLIF